MGGIELSPVDVVGVLVAAAMSGVLLDPTQVRLTPDEPWKGWVGLAPAPAPLPALRLRAEVFPEFQHITGRGHCHVKSRPRDWERKSLDRL